MASGLTFYVIMEVVYVYNFGINGIMEHDFIKYVLREEFLYEYFVKTNNIDFVFEIFNK